MSFLKTQNPHNWDHMYYSLFKVRGFNLRNIFKVTDTNAIPLLMTQVLCKINYSSHALM